MPGLQRKPVYAPRGVVATSQPLAATAGLHMLRRGGNAVDAALAAAIALTVVAPVANDIGGDLFAIVWDGQRLHGVNASGRSPAGLTIDRLGHGPTGEPELPERGWPSVTVPGAPAGWRDLHARFGRVPFHDLFDDAIVFAEDGFGVSPGVAQQWQRGVAAHAGLRGPEFAAWPDVFAPGGRAPAAGQTWRNPQAARTLRLIAASNAEAFYRGEIAEAMAAQSERTGGLLAYDDVAGHTNRWDQPLGVAYRGFEVWELPPNGQGIVALQALSILNGIDLTGGDAIGEHAVHAHIEAIKLGFADARAYVADPDLSPAPLAALLSPDYIATRRALLGDAAAQPQPGRPEPGGTVYVCSADEHGMMVSLIQSTYQGFGSYIAIPGYGFGLQNRGRGFSVAPGHPNELGPAKRPYHTIIPGFLTRDGEPVGPFGVMGGHMQPQGHVQLVAATVDRRLDPQAALDAPRWYWHDGMQVLLEPEFGPEILTSLRHRGHDAVVLADRGTVGQGQAIWRLRTFAGAGDGFVAGSEPRADGVAVGY